jgi:hypothetical protein
MLEFGDDPEVFQRDRYGDIRQIDSASDADTIVAGFRGSLALMRFRLVYEGNLHAGNNKRSHARDKWAIRRAIHPQLVGLWAAHPTLEGRGVYIQGSVGWAPLQAHESLGTVRNAINEPIVVASAPLSRR